MIRLRHLLSEIQNYREFQRLGESHRDFVFYSEFTGQSAYLMPFADVLANKFGRNVCYLTSSISDPVLDIENPRIESFYIGSGSVRTILFASLRANLMLSSLIDFGNYSLRRSKYSVRYIYLPHNLVSTHMVFPKSAFQGFDAVFCVGAHQVAELKKAEELYGYQKKILVENGYVRLDQLYRRAKDLNPALPDAAEKILLAPSWGPDSLFERGADKLIDTLLAAGKHVLARPHRESRRRAGSKLDRLQGKYAGHNRFTWLENSATDEILLQAHILVTDWSGSSLSFAFGVERPVLFIDLPRKVRNPNYQELGIEPIEAAIRRRVGEILDEKNIGNANLIIDEMWRRRSDYAADINRLRDKYVFNLGQAADRGAEYLVALADERRIPGNA